MNDGFLRKHNSEARQARKSVWTVDNITFHENPLANTWALDSALCSTELLETTVALVCQRNVQLTEDTFMLMPHEFRPVK